MDKSRVSDLMEVFRNYHFSLPSYYVHCFETVPSGISMELPVEPSRQAVDSVLKTIDFDKWAFRLCFKNWITGDFQDAKLSDDYVYEHLFQSDSGHMLIHVWFRGNILCVDFFYDINLPETEEWLLETNHHLRSTFGIPETPKFKVLVHHEGIFGTENVSTANFESVSIQEYYNDDFLEIDSIIVDAIGKKGSGMVLLHGDPGTGKTTYIKHLISKFKNREFIFVQNDFVRDLLKPGFVSFLLNNKNSILIIEDAEKVVASRDNFTEDSVVSTILQLTDGLFSDFLNIKIICTFNTDIDRIDKALLRKGRLIAKYRFLPLTAEKTAALAKKLGREDVTGSLTLADIFQFDKRDFKERSGKRLGFLTQQQGG
jgi:hypothetical protein